MRIPKSLVVLAAAPLLTAAMVKVQRPVPALIHFEGAPAAIGLVQVHVPKEVMERAPSDFANMSGMIAAAADKTLNRDGSGVKFKDFTNLGYGEAVIERPAQTGGLPWVVKGVPGVPAGVDTPLVTVAEVVDWRMDKKKSDDGKSSYPLAKVSLVLSTWTRDGATEVDTRYVTGTVVGSVIGHFGSEDVDILPSFGVGLGVGATFEPLETKWFMMADGRKFGDTVPTDRAQIFALAVADALGVYYFPYTPHVLADAVDVRGSKTTKDAIDKAKAGDLAGAQAAFEAATAADPTDEVAPFDVAMLRWAQNDAPGAIDWMNKSIAIKSSPLAQGELKQFQHFQEIQKTVTLK